MLGNSIKAMLLEFISNLEVPESDGHHRIFHGRGRTVPELEWLTVDCFTPVLVATVFREVESDTLELLRSGLTQKLADLNCDCLVIQHRYLRSAENEVVVGSLPTNPVATEQGLTFSLDFQRGQNLGFFVDMQPGRQWLAERVKDKRVLNLFSFTCAFSVVAVANGAERVINIDLSEAALGIGQRNHRLNDLPQEKAVFLPHNIFRSWKKLHSLGRYDLIIVDPPSEQKGSFVAKKDYAKVIKQLHRLLKPEADILACLNAPWLDESFLDAAVLDNLPGTEKVSRLPFAPGFDEADQQAGLKVIHYRYQRPENMT